METIYTLYTMSKNYGQRPSDLASIPDHDYYKWLRFEFDYAVNGAGIIISNRLEELDKKNKRVYSSVTHAIDKRKAQSGIPKHLIAPKMPAIRRNTK